MKANKKKLLLVTYDMTYSGTPHASMNLAIAVSDVYDIDVWTYNTGPFSDEFKNLGIGVREIDEQFLYAKDFKSIIKQYDCVIVYTLFCIDFALRVQDYIKTFLYLMEGSNIPQLCKDCNIDEEKIQKVNNLVCVSEYVRDYLKHRYDIDNVDIIHNYIEPIKKIRKKTRATKIKFLVSGTVERRKGQDIAIKAFSLLPQELRFRAELYILGDIPSWSECYYSELLQYVCENIYFLDGLKELKALYDFYQTIDVFLVPSRDESCSLVALEGAMLGKPIIVTENTGAKYLVENNSKNIIANEDIDGLSRLMAEYILNQRSIKRDGKKVNKVYRKKATRKVVASEIKKTIISGENDMSEVIRCICSVVMDLDEKSNELEETIESINDQVLEDNTYVQLFIKGVDDLSSININNERVRVYLWKDFLAYANKGEWLSYCRAGDRFTPMYFANTYQYIRNSMRVFVLPYYNTNDTHFLTKEYYDNGRIIDISKQPNTMIDYYDSVWIPRKFYNISLFEDASPTIAFMQNVYYTILQENKLQTIGTNLSEAVFATDFAKRNPIPSKAVLQNVYLRMINFGLAKNGSVSKNVQHMLLNLFKDFIANRYNINNLVTEFGDDLEEYREMALYCVSYISRDVLKNDKKLSLEQKLFVLRQGQGCESKYITQDNVLYYSNTMENIKIKYSPIVEYMFGAIDKSKLLIEATLFVPFVPEDFSIKLKYRDEFYDVRLRHNKKPEVLFDTAVISERIFFDAEIPLSDDGEITCYMFIGDEQIECTRYMYSRFFPVSMQFAEQYYTKNNWLLKCNVAKLMIAKATGEKIYECESAYKKNMSFNNQYLRDYYHSHKKQKQVWLIWDRPDAAGDNGEALFRFLIGNKKASEEYYFIINENCDDYERLRALYGSNVVATGSMKHKCLFVISDVLIGSQTDGVMWPVEEKLFRDIVSKKPFIFLQHGITKNDMSANYSKYYQNIRLFVAAGVPEYEETRNIANYGFDEGMVKLLGFPRFDYLEKRESKYIAILPTWRKYCVEKDSSGKQSIKDNFTECDYFQFYSKLLSDEELLKTCRKYGYKLLLMQHNVMKSTDSFFDANDCIEIADENWTYNRVISEAAILVTDYSSVSYDVAYLNKPVIYCQFDEEKFYKTHTYQEGYFDYKRDGFGPVVYDEKTAMKSIVNYIKNDCDVEKEYQRRVDDFFGYRDTNNCLRVSNAIREAIREVI
ncbi:CDP-glycerol glycerophosphotransferase family protein [Pseudobutyrivibrio xylanivorans]|uniref:Glycosyl transferase family 4 n=1 Tax=Pseudobutyrivibrio xylanivorans TaxID=185007 RepID=A0A5P6VSE1_PSEXY|nr:CDP-glycerol glycerophosphotransferase family protein [Pseudobutyrivibrio xylanivorans]QFJ53761.1 glycosyl transferase family 4 [Pseudobutyrivibrio xylanivorans]